MDNRKSKSKASTSRSKASSAKLRATADVCEADEMCTSTRSGAAKKRSTGTKSATAEKSGRGTSSERGRSGRGSTSESSRSGRGSTSESSRSGRGSTSERGRSGRETSERGRESSGRGKSRTRGESASTRGTGSRRASGRNSESNEVMMEPRSTREPHPQDALIVVPPVNIIDNEDGVIILFEVPGSSARDVVVEINHKIMTMTASSNLQRKNRPVVYQRNFRLSDQADIENITAKTQDGILMMRIPKSDRTRAHKVRVR